MSGRCATGILMTSVYAGRCPNKAEVGSVLCAECRQQALERVLAFGERARAEGSCTEPGSTWCRSAGHWHGWALVGHV
jgi:hypothetical protein